MNVTKVLTKDYENKTLGGSGKNKANSKPNKANLLKAKMNVNFYSTKDYENIANWTLFENKPNINPKQSQTNPISPPPTAKQTQYKPKQSQFQRQKNAHILIFAFPQRPIFYAQKKDNLL